jgi:hypothetical protein
MMALAPDFSTQPARRRARPADLVLLAIAVLSLLLAAQASWSAGRNAGRARVEVDQARSEARRSATAARALPSLAGPTDTLATRALLTAEAPPPRVLADLETVLPKDVRLEEVTLVYGDRLKLDLHVAARRGAAYDEFLARLSGSPLFADVVPGIETRSGEVKASVKASYRGVDGP